MATRSTITGVRSVELELADPERSARFYTDVWHLSEVARAGDTIYLRGTAEFHHILALRPSHGPARIGRVVYEARTRDIVDAIHARLAAIETPVETPGSLDRIEGGYGFGLADPSGRCLAVVAGAACHDDDEPQPDRPHKIAHVNFNDPDAARLTAFYVDGLGMKLVDRAGRQAFLNADSPDHSSIVICQADANTLNHLSFEMADLDSVMRGAGRMSDAGYPIEWGVGRHGCADNVFAYFAGPEEIPLEYTSDVLQIDDSYPYNGPEYWAWPTGRLDQWGVTPPHTKRWKRVQSLFAFRSGDYRLRG
ncbi:VOC family protein [Bosea sp. RCC_152_1]|uniref:VOC family protein n=1 Tax=Bosea sp. RCC_152_1 TaxID=3239228 RepID=UPI003525620A